MRPMSALLEAVRRLGLAVLALCAPLAASASEPFRAATFNIGYIVDPSGLPKWEARRDAVTHVLKTMDADIIGFQEMETFSGGKFNNINRQRDWILQTVPGYRAAAVGDPKVFPSTQPILYRPDRFDLVDQGWFYFSTTPDIIYSRSFDGGFDYYTSTARFRERASSEMLTVFNVHTDIRSGGNRRKATRMVAERAKLLIEAGERVIVLGDFNALWFQRNVTRIEDSGLTGTRLAGASFHFGTGIGLWPAIDHIFHGAGIERLGKAVIHRDKSGGALPSDHYPVSGQYRLN